MIVESKMSPGRGKDPEKITDTWNAFMSSNLHGKIFDEKAKDLVNYPWKKKIVKITSKETGLSIYRIWKGTPLYVESKDTLFVDDSAKYALIKTKEANKVNLVLSKGSRLKFYWNHFDNATRISFKLGLTSVFLGALSIIMALPYNCIKIWFGNFLQLFFGG